MSRVPAARPRHWIFDMDGTLTVPVHDFPAMRRELGVPEGMGTLEGVYALPEPLRSERHRRLDEISMDYARLARPQQGARALLEELLAGGCRIGLVTRNSRPSALETLACAGLAGLFPPETVLTRDEPPPKPSPEQVLRLMSQWGAAPDDAVLVGDAIYDLQAGRAAGIATVLVDPAGDSPHRALADQVVGGMAELLARVVGELA